jgi:hypothetical protein
MDEEEEDASIYQAVLSPDCSDVRLLKGETLNHRKYVKFVCNVFSLFLYLFFYLETHLIIRRCHHGYTKKIYLTWMKIV